MNPSNARIVHHAYAVSQKPRSQRGLLCNWNVACAGGDDEDLPVPVGFGQLAHHTGTSALVIRKAASKTPQPLCLLRIQACDEHPLLSDGKHRGNDAGNLFGCLPRPVYHFGHTGANTSLVVNAGVFEVGHRIHANLMYQLLGRHPPIRNSMGKPSQFVYLHQYPPQDHLWQNGNYLWRSDVSLSSTRQFP